MKRKIVKESLNESIKIEGHYYDVIHLKNGGRVKVGKDGILGDNNEFISWAIIRMLSKKY